MWDNAFNEDDPDNPRLADEYGIVMGTSHHEPMMRAHKEWTSAAATIRQRRSGTTPPTPTALQRFFREGIARNKDYENVVTIGMRGDGDEGDGQHRQPRVGYRPARSASSPTSARSSPRRCTPTRPGAAALGALHRGAEVLRRTACGCPTTSPCCGPTTTPATSGACRPPAERKRSGGAGIYYHIDMHGGPFPYQWINTNPLPKIGEQMNLAYRIRREPHLDRQRRRPEAARAADRVLPAPGAGIPPR